MISWPAGVANHNGCKLSRKANDKLARSGRAPYRAKLSREGMISWPAQATHQSGGKLSSQALISWPARAVRHNGGKLSRKAMIIWPARAARHKGEQMKQKANDTLAAERSLRERAARHNRAERQMIGWPSRAARMISLTARATPFSHSQKWE